MTTKKTTLAPSEENPLRSLLDKAEEHFQRNEYALAEQVAKEVLEPAEGKRAVSLGEKGLALQIIGACCLRAARFDEALDCYKHALTAAEGASLLSLQCRVLNGTANVHTLRSNFDLALSIAERGLAVSQMAHDKKEESIALNFIGMIHSEVGRLPLALDYHTRALALAEEIGDKGQQAGALTNIGVLHAMLADHPRALDYNCRALAMFEQIGNKRGISMNLGFIGSTYHALAEYPRALEYITRSLHLAEELGDKPGAARTLGNLGNVYFALEDYSRALEYHERALVIAEEVGDRGNATAILGNMGLAHMEQGDYAKALDYLNRALKLSMQIGNVRASNCWMIGIATTQFELGNLDVAYRGFLDSLDYQRNILKSNEGIPDTLLHLGKVLIAQEKQKEGLDRIEEALRLAEELGDKRIASHAHEYIASAYAKSGDIAKAFEHLTKHHEIAKEIFGEESKKRIDIFNMRVAIAEIEHGVEVQKLRIEHMEHDLANSAIHLAAQTELLDHFRTDLTQIFHEIEEPLAALKKIKQKLKALPYVEINWAKFEEQFSSVHPEFTAKLEDKYPALTRQEIRMCALVRVGLRNPEIVKLLCLSERTLENHRFNIRKKLALKTEQSLHEFLSKGI